MSDIKHTAYNIMKSAIDRKIDPTLEEIRKINSFFLVRYISNDPASIYIANALNCRKHIPVESQYKFIRNTSINKVAFINYPKKEKIISDKKLSIIANHYNISIIVAKEYVKIMGKDRAEEIIKKYSHLNKK